MVVHVKLIAAAVAAEEGPFATAQRDIAISPFCTAVIDLQSTFFEAKTLTGCADGAIGPRSESIPAGFAGEQARFTGCGIYSCALLRDNQRRGGAGAGAIRSTSAKRPPLDVFRFSLSFLPPDKRVRGCLLHP